MNQAQTSPDSEAGIRPEYGQLAPTEEVALLHLDIETTGLKEFDQPFQIAYALDVRGETLVSRSIDVAHAVRPADWVLRNTSYRDAGRQGWVSRRAFVATLFADLSLVGDMKVMQVGVCPAFDQRHLARLFAKSGVASPIDYHLIDVSQEARALFAMPNAPGLSKLLAFLGMERIGQPHRAADDMKSARIAYYRLRAISEIVAPHASAALAALRRAA